MASSSVARPNAELQKYIELVDRCARNRLNYPISNGSPAHARVLISKLFETARQETCIVSGKLTDTTSKGDDIYGDAQVIKQAQGFLQHSGATLRIVLEKAPLHNGRENRFLKAVVEDKARQGTVVVYPGHEELRSANAPHFMVTDALAYRFETHDSHNDENSVRAIANFGDPDIAKGLQSLFTDIATYLEEFGTALRFPPGENLAV